MASVAAKPPAVLRSAIRVAGAFALLVAPACIFLERVPREHIVMFDNRGQPLDPSPNLWGRHSLLTGYERLEPEEYDTYLDELFAGLERWFRGHRERDQRKKKRVLIFIHGGLNTQVGSVERATELHPQIAAAGYYPIFVNWQSSLLASYWDHLWSIRQGKDLFPWGAMLAPYYLLQDLTRGFVRLPVTMYFQVVNVYELVIEEMTAAIPRNRVTSTLGAFVASVRRVLGVENPQAISATLEERYRASRQHFTRRHPDAVAVVKGEDLRRRAEKIIPWVTHVATLPTKLVSAAFIEAGGTSAWASMLRGVRVLFHAEEDYFRDTPDVEPAGGLAVFLRRLERERDADSERGVDWEITLVAHSMGTIVLNEIVREFGRIPYHRIVYMAAACTVRDYQDSVYPYLRSPAGARTEVFHLTLHEIAEAGERPVEIAYIDPVLRGSLLVWIDSSFSTPMTHLDLTLGRYNNLMAAAHQTPSAVRGRIHVKAFDAGKAARVEDGRVVAPQKHADFTLAPFWEPAFWEPEGRPEHPALESPGP